MSLHLWSIITLFEKSKHHSCTYSPTLSPQVEPKVNKELFKIFIKNIHDNWWETLLKIPDRNRTIRESIAINDVNILQTLIRHNSKTYSRIILKSISEERVLFQLSNDGFMFSKSFLLLVPTGGSHTVWISTIFEDFDALANINRYDTRVNRQFCKLQSCDLNLHHWLVAGSRCGEYPRWLGFYWL